MAYPTYAVDATPYCGCLYANGYIWAASEAAGPGTLRKINKTTGATLQTITLGGNAPRNMCLDASGNIWLSLYGSNSVCKVQMSDGAVLGTYSCGANTGPIGICYHAATDTIWTANWLLATVSKITASTGALINQYSSNGVNPNGITSLGAWIFVANYQGSWVRIVAATGAWDLNQTSGGLTLSGITTDGTYLWCVCYTQGEIHKRTTSFAAVGVPVLTYANQSLLGWITAGSDGYIYVAGRGNSNAGSVWKIDQATGLRVAAYFTGALACEGPAFDGNNVWVTNSNNSTVMKIPTSGSATPNLTSVTPNNTGAGLLLAFDSDITATAPSFGPASGQLTATTATLPTTSSLQLGLTVAPPNLTEVAPNATGLLAVFSYPVTVTAPPILDAPYNGLIATGATNPLTDRVQFALTVPVAGATATTLLLSAVAYNLRIDLTFNKNVALTTIGYMPSSYVITTTTPGAVIPTVTSISLLNAVVTIHTTEQTTGAIYTVTISPGSIIATG
jgi:DNA-binding beta-propeller fold protein YncE